MAAKVWTLKEMIETIKEKNDPDKIRELCRRFPMLTVTLASVDYNSAMAMAEIVPDYVRLIGMERQLLHDQSQGDPDDVEGETENAPAEPEEAEEAPEKDPVETKREKDRKRQQRKRQKDRDEKDAKEAEEAAAAAEEKAEAGKYDEIGAVKLFEMCRARGLDVQPRKKQRFYIDILEADDEKKAKEAADAASEEDEEDWGEEEDLEEEVKEKPQKTSKAKKSMAKKDAEPEPEEEDEEDWEI